MNVQTSKLKYIKKVTGIILILAMLLLPFTSLLNVKAETTQITVDSSVTKSDDPNSKKVVNTTKLTVTGGTDLLKAYKVLDIYYNEKNNEMSYDFTSDFTNFKSSSYATTTTKDFSTLTVSEYLAYGEEGANQTEFDLLAAQFSKYIRKNNVAGLEFTSDTTTVPEGKDSFDVYIENIEAGAYLILPTTNNPFTDSDGLYSVNTYGALIANVVFTVQDGTWYLDAISRSIKQKSNYLTTGVIDCAPSKIIEVVSSEDGPTFTTSFYKNREYSYFFGTSVLNRYTTEESPWKVVITLPEGIDYTNVYTLFSLKSGMYLHPAVNNKLYYENENGEKVIANITTSEKTITIDSPTDAIEDFDLTLIVGVKLSDNPVLGEVGNTIQTAATYTTDPYSDPIGTTTLTSEDKITTYGLQITNKSTSDDTVLSGGVFGIYTDSTCSDSSKIGEVTVTNGVGKFEGIIEGDLYVKQLKAPSGYRLSTDVAHVTVDTASLTSEGYYPLEVTNAKAGLLPSTGGLGTIFYTLIGLLVVGAGAYEVVKYSKKQVNS